MWIAWHPANAQFLASSSSESDDAGQSWSRLDRHGLRKLRQKMSPASASAALSPGLEEPAQDLAPRTSGKQVARKTGVRPLPRKQRQRPAPLTGALAEGDATAAAGHVLTSKVAFDSPKKAATVRTSLSLADGGEAGPWSGRSGGRSAEGGNTVESWRIELKAALGPEHAHARTHAGPEDGAHHLSGADGQGTAGRVFADGTPVFPSWNALSPSSPSAANSSLFSVGFCAQVFALLVQPGACVPTAALTLVSV